MLWCNFFKVVLASNLSKYDFFYAHLFDFLHGTMIDFMRLKNIKSIKINNPGSEIHVLASIHNAKVLNNIKYIDRVLIIEPNTNLFINGIGNNTDIVTKEMYSWIDQGENALTLKPELTAPVIRSYIQHQMGNKNPMHRLYYFDALFLLLFGL